MPFSECRIKMFPSYLPLGEENSTGTLWLCSISDEQKKYGGPFMADYLVLSAEVKVFSDQESEDFAVRAVQVWKSHGRKHNIYMDSVAEGGYGIGKRWISWDIPKGHERGRVLELMKIVEQEHIAHGPLRHRP
jgi:hypothetical protein